MNINSSKFHKLGLDYFSVDNSSLRQRDQLLRLGGTKNVSPLTINDPSYLARTLKKGARYLDSLKEDIHFSPEVAAQRCIHLLSYNDLFYKSLYDTEINKKQSSSKLVHPIPSRHRCAHHSKDTTLPSLPPVRPPVIDRCTDIISMQTNDDSQEENHSPKERRYWDEYFLSMMSKETAQYVAFEASRDEAQAKRLQSLAKKWYGTPPAYRELIPNDTEEPSTETVTNDVKSTFPYKYFMDLVESERAGESTKDKKEFINEPSQNQRISDLLSREISFFDKNQQTDPYGDETKASFYRLPLLLRRQKKNFEILHKDSGNKTAENLAPYQVPITPLRRLDTVLNPRIGDKVFMTDNQFQQDLFMTTEINQRKATDKGPDEIVIENKVYKKALQPIWPDMITYGMPSEDNLNYYRPVKDRIIKGHNRWINLPEKEESNLNLSDHNESLEEQARLESRKNVRDNSSVNLIVDQWRKKWQLSQKYNDSTVEALLKDMGDVHPTIRMQAIVTVAKSGMQQTPLLEDRGDSSEKGKETISADNVPQVLLQSIEVLLDDSHQQVKKAAAVALHSLEKTSEKSFQILRDMLGSGSGIDRWTAAQCLALSNVCDSYVISVLVDQLMNSEDFLIHEKASLLLAKISFHTRLVHGMLGEKLNTISWRQRIIICKTLPLLHGSLNKDILKKLIYLMWQDDHKQVRIAASQAVGKTGNGKAVHDELISKLQNHSEIVRADALEKIGILKVMTTRMMPAFLEAFTDDFVIVRKEVCHTCYRLAIQDETCMTNLLNIAKYDSSFKVKIYAMRALGKICRENPEIRACFIWALQFEYEVRVRYEAMRSLLISNKMDQEMVDLLKSRFLVEDDQGLLKIIRKSLNNVGINPDEDIDAVAEVKLEVKRFLSDKNKINDLILLNEAKEEYSLQREFMIATSNEDFINSDNRYTARENSSGTLKVLFMSQLSEADQKGNLCDKEESDGIFASSDSEKEHVETVGKLNDKEKDGEDLTEEQNVYYVKMETTNSDITENVDIEENEQEKEIIFENNNEVINLTDDNNEKINNMEHEIRNDILSEDATEKDDSIVKEDRIPQNENEQPERELTFENNDTIVNLSVDDKETKTDTEGEMEDNALNKEVRLNGVIIQTGSDNKTEDKENITLKIDNGEIINEKMVEGVPNPLSENNKKHIENTERLSEDDDANEGNNDKCFVKYEGMKDILNEIYNEESSVLEDDGMPSHKDVNTDEHYEETNIRRLEDEDRIFHCTYQLPFDASYLKEFTEVKTMSWVTLAVPTVDINLSGLEVLERAISPRLREEVNQAIDCEGIDCSSWEPC